MLVTSIIHVKFSFSAMSQLFEHPLWIYQLNKETQKKICLRLKVKFKYIL